jgi:hypothetical protein
VDADAQVNALLYKKYGVEFLPTLLFANADGKELNRVGMVNIDELAKAVQKAKAQTK